MRSSGVQRERALQVAIVVASVALVAVALATTEGHSQLAQSWPPLLLYLGAWAAAVWAAGRLWRAATAPHAQVAKVAWRLPTGAGAWALAIPVLAFAAASYWNGAILDPLQFRGFPDYVTQMRGARKLLEGALPYDPAIRVWTDVNLPPITLLFLFVPFTPLSEMAGRLAYFTLNHLAFLAGLATLVAARRPTKGALLWGSLAVALGAAFEPWHDSLRLGQQNGIVFACLAVSAVAAAQRRDALAGVALAAALIGKPSSALLGVYFIFAGRWRTVFAAALTGIVAFLVTLPWAGIENWRFYLLDKAPQILAGTPQQSNVALLALHARLFLPLEALASFDAMPDVPVAQALTRISQLAGAYALWRFIRRPGRRESETVRYLEFCVVLSLSLVLVGHAWQSYVTWLIVGFITLADPHLWQAAHPTTRRLLGTLAALCYPALAVNDVTLHRVVGSTSFVAGVFAALPTVALLVFAYVLATLTAALEAQSRSAVAEPEEPAAIASAL